MPSNNPSQPAATTDEEHLPPRLREIYRELAHGRCYKEIAARLGISHESVRQHVVRLRRELGTVRVPRIRRKRGVSFT